MSTFLRTLLLALSPLVFLSGLRAQQFTPGNLAILQTNGTTNNSTASIIEINPTTTGQTPVSTILINGTTGTNALRFSASAGTTGYMANSNDGTLLCFTGHNTTTTSGNINTVTARGVGTLNASQTFNLAATYTGAAGNQTRCATSNDNSKWFVGDQGGIYTNNTTIPSPAGNFRGVKAFGATIYAGTTSGIQVGTIATTTGSTFTGLPGLAANGNFSDFYLIASAPGSNTYDILYVLTNNGTTTASIDKYSLVSGTWTANGSYASSFGGLGIAARQSGAGASIYVTTGNGSTAANSVVECTDDAGFNTTINITTANNITLYTAPPTGILKGIAFAPVAPTTPPLPPQMRITEFMYKGNNGEFVEFTNVGATPIDMTGWSYSDNSHHPGDVLLSAFGTVQPGESVILTETTAGDFRTDWNLCNGIKIIGGNSIDNLGRADAINLFDASHNLVDSLVFDDQHIAGTVQTQNASAWVTAAGLGTHDPTAWTLSTVGDGEQSDASTGGDIGSPGKSTRATVAFTPCTGPIPGAPTIVLDVTNTSDLLDGGATAPPATPYAISGVLNDATDPASTAGIAFMVNDDVTSAGSLTLTAASSNTTVVPNANLVLSGSGATRRLTITPAAVGYSTITLTVSDGTLTSTYQVNYAASQSTSSTAQWFTGISDASAAIPLDDNSMVIADDEHNELYVYNRTGSGLPIKTFDFNPGNLLALTDGSPGNWKELDVEAATGTPDPVHHPGRTYWLGSMSNSSSFNDKPNRNRLVAIDISGTGASTTFSNVGYTSSLRQLLLVWGDDNGYNFTASAAEGVDPKTINGFNIEGMVFGPDKTTLYLGFRAPLVPKDNTTTDRTMAVIAPIANFETWFNNGAPTGLPAIGAPILLDLGGRSIRDLIRLPNGMYVIVAGMYDGTPLPAIYTWTGNAADAPVYQPAFDLTGQNAEAAMPVNIGGQLAFDRLQVISDDGDRAFYNDGVAAKDLTEDNFKKFGSQMTIATSGLPLPLDFESFDAQRSGSTNVILNWKMGIAGDEASFDILRSTNGSDYSTVGTVTGLPNQTAYSFTDAHAPASRLYYRIRANKFSGQTILSTIRVLSADGTSDAQVRIYPNPVTTGTFSVLVTAAGAKTVNIYNNAGILYQQRSFTGTALDISTASWPKGFYLLRIGMTDGSIVTEKVIVQ